MNVIDLFAGAGGLSEGFRQEGYKIIAHVEMDYSASLTLKTREAYHYLKEKNQIDVYKDYLLNKISREKLYSFIPSNILEKVINEEINDESIERIFRKIDDLRESKKIDMIIGGPPCQAYSLVGRARDPERMLNDPRNYLYRHYINFLKKYNPKYFVFENVLGILSAGMERYSEALRRKWDYQVTILTLRF
ncbi:DNA cytosine methyltransferase [Bacillus haynesii]|nr:DNA cytosine methyltransferase [Bacillus haynesii]MCY7753292.1 DNA cytosine methyltransferase [Bacillus haynesii]